MPPVTVVGFRLTLPIVPDPGDGGFMVRVADALLADIAVIVAEAPLATTDVETVNVPLLWPAAISRLPGTVAEPLFDESVMDTPPAPAGAARMTVPVEEAPPVTVVGLRLTLPIVPVPGDGGFNVRVADALLAELAVIVAAVLLDTMDVVTENVPTLWPVAITRLAGTLAAG